MTRFAGETFEAWHHALDFDGVTVMGNTELPDGVTISIWTRDFAEKLVDERAMTFDAQASVTIDEGEDVGMVLTGLWLYRWDTTDVDPDAYVQKCTAHGVNGTTAFEYKPIRLRKVPEPA